MEYEMGHRAFVVLDEVHRETAGKIEAGFRQGCQRKRALSIEREHQLLARHSDHGFQLQGSFMFLVGSSVLGEHSRTDFHLALHLVAGFAHQVDRIALILIANVLQHLGVGNEVDAQSKGKWFRERLRIVERHLQPDMPKVAALEPLGDAKVLCMRVA